MTKQQESYRIKELLRKHGYSVRGVRHGTGTACLSITIRLNITRKDLIDARPFVTRLVAQLLDRMDWDNPEIYIRRVEGQSCET